MPRSSSAAGAGAATPRARARSAPFARRPSATATSPRPPAAGWPASRWSRTRPGSCGRSSPGSAWSGSACTRSAAGWPKPAAAPAPGWRAGTRPPSAACSRTRPTSGGPRSGAHASCPPQPRLRPIRGRPLAVPQAPTRASRRLESEWIEVPVPALVEPALFAAAQAQLRGEPAAQAGRAPAPRLAAAGPGGLPPLWLRLLRQDGPRPGRRRQDGRVRLLPLPRNRRASLRRRRAVRQPLGTQRLPRAGGLERDPGSPGGSAAPCRRIPTPPRRAAAGYGRPEPGCGPRPPDRGLAPGDRPADRQLCRRGDRP